MEKRLFKAVLTFTTRPGSVGRSVGGTDARRANLQSFTFYSRYTFFRVRVFFFKLRQLFISERECICGEARHMRIVPTFFGRHDIVLAISEHCGLSCALGNANNYSAISTARIASMAVDVI